MPTLPVPCLCLVTDRRLAPAGDLESRVSLAVAGGVNLVQIREKDLAGGELLALSSALQRGLSGGVPLLVNERVDVARAVGASGVQLGEAALAPSAAREILGNDSLIGRSVHSVAGAVQAERDGADFLLVGTMFATSSHPGEEPSGPGLIGRVKSNCSLPVIGIGGINAGNAPLVMEAGAAGVAVISAILAAPDPREAARRIRQAITGAGRAAVEEDMVHRD